MQRRDFVRAVISVSLAPKVLLAQEAGSPAPSLPAPVPWTLGLNSKAPLPVTEVADTVAAAELTFFTPRQMSTLTRLSDLLLPPIGGKPGALQAQTPEFLDFLVGSSPEPRRTMYSAGLDWLDAESHKAHKKPFASLDDAQAGAMLKPLLRTWMNDHPPTGPHVGFINIAHDDIRNATVNSKAWSEAPRVGAEESTAIGLFWSPIEPDTYGMSAECAHMQAHILATPKTGHSMPIYKR
ncbi:MAG TPA: gluconate 2-dehydrogenase subunit 3 family protein [Terracidiphilus sp.]|jgi:Gluconate 2-dehydrogenase subunit 3|nr:gluconate 2-dehydrogenase subunit 3 family protein [Terracidiphilus sp.]HUX27709.1 gluconate 2-dehydrogenase subunit 3 family protein [Terracidiphilus sp.]